MRSKFQQFFVVMILSLSLAGSAHPFQIPSLSSIWNHFKDKDHGRDNDGDWDGDRDISEKDGDHDDPAEQRREMLRRILPPGKKRAPIEHLIQAQQQMLGMRRYRLGGHEILAPKGPGAGNEGSEYLVPEDAPRPGNSGSSLFSIAKSLLPNSPAPISSACNWQSLGPGNIGGRTRAIVINPQNPNILYAGGATGGVFKTLDNQTWVSTGLMMDLGIGCLTMDPTDPNTIYCGTGEDVRGVGIFKTTDAGATWNLLPTSNNPGFYYVRRILVSPHNHLRLYAATDQGVYISNDGGNSWGQIYSGNCEDIRIRPDTANDYILLSVGDWNGVLYINTAAETGGTWKQVLTDEGTAGSTMGLLSIDIAPSAPMTMYAMAADPGHGWNLHAFYRSTDGGNTWNITVDNRSNVNNSMSKWLISYGSDMCSNPANTPGGQGWYDNVIAVDPVNPNRVWADGIDIWRSDDGGNSFAMAGDWTRDVHADQHAIVFDPHYNGTTNTTMYFGNDGGVYRSDNPLDTLTTNFCTYSSSVQFHFLNSGWLTTEFYDGTSYPGGATYFGGSQDNGTERGTDAKGVNAWDFIGGGDGAYVAVDPTNTNILFEYYPIQKSTNGGAGWSQAMTGITDPNSHKVFIMDPENPQDMWNGGGMMWLSTNEANSWTQASAALHGTVSAIAASPKSSNVVMAGDDQGYIYYNNAALSATSTTTWNSTRPVAGGYVSWISFDTITPTTAFAVFSNYDVTHVWKTTNGGASWSPSDGSGANAIPDIPCRTVLVDPLNSNRVFVGTDFGIFVSLDGGATWTVCSDFPAVATYSFNVDAASYSLFAFTRGRGAYKICLASGAPTPTATITNTPQAGSGSGLCGQYFNNNNLTGSPCGTRLDPYINYMLPTNGITVPGCGLLATNFSVKWTGTVEAEYSETYTFYTNTDDGVRFIITNPSTGTPVTLINHWVTEGPTEYTGVVPFAFVAGQKYTIEMDYFQGGGGAMASLSWQSAQTPKEIIPTIQLFPSASCAVPTSTPTPTRTLTPTPGVTPPAGTGTGLCAQYFTNTNLTGSACVTQLVPNVDWGLILPPAQGGGISIGGACGTLSTNFSIKYTGTVQAQFTENYTFYTNTDDGVTLKIDTGSGLTTVINHWITEGPTLYSAGPFALTAGQKYTIEMDYYQGGGGGQAQLMWSSANTPIGIIPTSQLYPSALCASLSPTSTPTVTGTPSFTPTPSSLCPDWAIVGNATLGSAVTLTTATNGQVSAAWNKTCINLNQNFNLMFKAYFGAGAGADGIDFVLQNDPRGIAAMGGAGNNKGYSATDGTAITPSMAFTLETYGGNGTLQPEEGGNTTATCANVTAGTCPYTFPSNIANGAEHTYNVVWNASTHSLSLYIDGSLVMTYGRDLVTSVFGGSSCVYYGFTASTGGANNLQYVYGINCLTPTKTNTPASTFTPTFTLTKTVTPSFTPTATASFTATKTFTLSSTPTSSPTKTPTSSLTATPTASPTKTPTSSPSPTNTGTPSSTPSATPTQTFTLSPFNTFTQTPTSTFTSISTNTPVPPTATWSSTPTATKTFTFSPFNTLTQTPSFTFTPTSSFTSTSTSTRTNTPIPPTATWSSTPTATQTFTLSPFHTFTQTPSSTFTRTPSSTFTPTPTPPVLQLSIGSGSPGNQTVLSGTGNVADLRVTLTNNSSSAVTLTGMTVAVSGGAGATQVILETTGGTVLGTGTVSGGTAVITFNQTLVVPPGSTATYQLDLSFSNSASGTYSLGLSAGGLSASSSSGVVSFTGSATGSVITVAHPTATSTPTAVWTTTPTPGTSACSGIPAWNGNFVYYPSGSKVNYNGELYQIIQPHTSEPNWMPPAVPALWQDLGPCSNKTTVVVYPNPSTSSGQVQLAIPISGSSEDVAVQVFTTNFRKIAHKDYPQTPRGLDLTLELSDDWGHPFANGLYYVLVQTPGHHWVAKLLVLH